MKAKDRTRLEVAFHDWSADHGVVWFPADVELAEAVAAVLNIDLVWSGDVERVAAEDRAATVRLYGEARVAELERKR